MRGPRPDPRHRRPCQTLGPPPLALSSRGERAHRARRKGPAGAARTPPPGSRSPPARVCHRAHGLQAARVLGRRAVRPPRRPRQGPLRIGPQTSHPQPRGAPGPRPPALTGLGRVAVHGIGRDVHLLHARVLPAGQGPHGAAPAPPSRLTAAVRPARGAGVGCPPRPAPPRRCGSGGGEPPARRAPSSAGPRGGASAEGGCGLGRGRRRRRLRPRDVSDRSRSGPAAAAANGGAGRGVGGAPANGRRDAARAAAVPAREPAGGSRPRPGAWGSADPGSDYSPARSLLAILPGARRRCAAVRRREGCSSPAPGITQPAVRSPRRGGPGPRPPTPAPSRSCPSAFGAEDCAASASLSPPAPLPQSALLIPSPRGRGDYSMLVTR